MSFHKLKLGARKKDGTKSITSKQEKIKERNQDLIQVLNLQNKSHQKKPNMISMSSNMDSQFFSLKKAEFQTAPKTDRLHKIQRMQFPAQNIKRSSKQSDYHFNYSNSEQNQQYTASKLIDFLSLQPLQNKYVDQYSTRSMKISSKQNQKQLNSKKIQSNTKNQGRLVHQIKLLNFNQAQFGQNSTSIIKQSKRTIQLQQKPLNYQASSPLGVQKDQDQVTKKQQKSVVIHRIKKSESLSFQNQNKYTSQVEHISQVLSQVNDHPSKSILIEIQNKNNIVQKIQVAQQTRAQQHKLQQIHQQCGQKVHKNDKPSFIAQKTQKPLIVNKHVIKTQSSGEVTNRKQINSSVKQKNSKIDVQESPKQSKIVESPVSQKSKSDDLKSFTHQSLSYQTQQNIISPTKSKLNYKPINQIQVTILQQNKSLTQQVEKLRRQRDELLFSNKRFQVQLLQSNCKQYYERQISRLKSQVQTLQCTHEELKHLNFILQNKNKQLESSQDLNKKQLKKLIRQLEQIKIQSTKQKYQLKQKGSSLQALIKQLQQRNSDLSDKFQDYYKKHQQLQKSYKQQCQQRIKLKKLNQILQTKISNIQKSHADKIKHYQHQISKYTSQNLHLCDQYRNFKRQSQSEVDNLKQNIKQLNLKRQSQTLLIQSRTKTLQKHNNKIQAQLQVVRMEQTVKQLSTQIQKRSELIRQLNQRIDSMISMNDYEQLRKQLQTVIENKAVMKQQYEMQILKLQAQIQKLKDKIQQNQNQLKQRQHIVLNVNKKISSSNKIQTIQHKQNFQQILKLQILECDHLRQQIFAKSQQLFQSKQECQQLKTKFQTLRNQQQIMKKQFTSQQNNSKVKKQILQQQMVNEIQSIKRKMNMLQKRYQSKIKENKQKQSFIQTYIIGKTSHQSDANYLIKELQRVFLENQRKNITQ